MPEPPEARQAESKRSHALRVTVGYEGGTLKVESVQRVAMIVPPPTTAAPEEGHAGFWLEVRDPLDELVFHRALHDPMPQDIETFGPEGTTLSRQPRLQPAGSFDVLIPDLDDAHTFMLWGSVSASGARTERARPLVRASFDALRRMPPAKTGDPQGGKPT